MGFVRALVLFWKVHKRLPDSLMLEIFPSISAGSDKPRNGLMRRVDGGKSSSGGVWVPGPPLLPVSADPPPAPFFLEPAMEAMALGCPSWACFKCCFILSGRENSFWQILQGKTFRAAPSWYRKACLWKLYLFLKCLLICTRSHSTHLLRVIQKSCQRKIQCLSTVFISCCACVHWDLSHLCNKFKLPKSEA